MMVVDNRYSGVGYEPPFETPTDKDFMAGHIEALKEENEQLRTRIAELEANIKSYRTELSKEMPLDFKDWWQNSKKEWPLVARLVLETRRKHIEEIGASLDRMMQDNSELESRGHRLEAELAKAKKEAEEVYNDMNKIAMEYRAENERLQQNLRDIDEENTKLANRGVEKIKKAAIAAIENIGSSYFSHTCDTCRKAALREVKQDRVSNMVDNAALTDSCGLREVDE